MCCGCNNERKTSWECDGGGGIDIEVYQTEEEYPVEFLNQWEMELKMLEDWLDDPELEGGFQGIAKPEETC